MGRVGALIGVCAAFLPAAAQAHDLPEKAAAQAYALPEKVAGKVTVTAVTYQGWKDSLRLSNGIVEAVVVPRIGRIMSFRFVGDPASDPIFNNKDLLGKSGADAGKGNWANFGGDKLWPSPQYAWAKFIGGPWPPDPAFDGAPQQAVVVRDGVKLISGRSAAFGLQATRTITMRPGMARLFIAQTLRRFAAPAGHGATVREPLGIWSVTQVRGDSAVFLPVNAASRFPSRFVTYDGQSRPILKLTPLPHGWRAGPGMLIGERDPKDSYKVGVDASQGWLAALYDGNVLFSERYVDRPGGTYPDAGCRAEVYSNAGDLAYLEMELLGPMQPIPTGKTMHYDLTWELKQLKTKPAGDAAAAKAVMTAMRR
jgi:hypothetical protein